MLWLDQFPAVRDVARRGKLFDVASVRIACWGNDLDTESIFVGWLLYGCYGGVVRLGFYRRIIFSIGLNGPQCGGFSGLDRP